jgi:NADH dehydrogenase
MSARIVVVGGGFAGFWAAVAARRVASPKVDVVLVSDRPVLEMRPRLYQASPERMAVPIQPLVESIGVEFRGARAETLEIPAKRVTFSGGTSLGYDRLVVATGSCLQRPPIPGAERAHSIDSRAEAIAFDTALARACRENDPKIAVLGAGFTGIELSLELRDRIAEHADATVAERANVILVDRAPWVGPELGPGPRPAIEAALRNSRVDVRLGASPTEIRDDGLLFQAKPMIQSHLTVLTTGSVAAPFVRQVPGTHDVLGRLVASRSLQAPEAPDVFAAGDAVVVDDGTGHAVLQSCQHALQGRFAGENSARDLAGLPMEPFRQPNYITCLDLGRSGAIFTRGWERTVERVGADAKRTKQRINTVAIYPPPATRPQDLIACSSLDPHEQARVLYG